MVFHSSHIEGVTNSAGTGPNPELGGYGTGPADRGASFFFEWVRDRVGRWEYPDHVRASPGPQARTRFMMGSLRSWTSHAPRRPHQPEPRSPFLRMRPGSDLTSRGSRPILTRVERHWIGGKPRGSTSVVASGDELGLGRHGVFREALSSC
jgi:hypothetical protein